MILLRTKYIGQIRDLNPCYDPSRYLPETWSGTALDILDITACPATDRLWVALQVKWIEYPVVQRAFAVWCARECIKLLENRNPCLEDYCMVADKVIKDGERQQRTALNTTYWAAQQLWYSIPEPDYFRINVYGVVTDAVTPNAGYGAFHAHISAYNAHGFAAVNAAGLKHNSPEGERAFDAAKDAFAQKMLDYLRQLITETEP